MTARAHLALRLAAIALIAAASLMPRAGGTAAKGPSSTTLTDVSGPALARR